MDTIGNWTVVYPNDLMHVNLQRHDACELKLDDDMYYHSKVSFFVSLLTALESTENENRNDWKF